jgi:hypothetical protein
MRKLILSIFVIVTSLGAYAQDESASLGNNDAAVSIKPDSSKYIHPDGYMMTDGFMMTVKNGVFAKMDKNVTLSNGTLVMSSGSYIKKGETKQTIKEGEHIDLNGIVTPMNSSDYSAKNKSTEKSMKIKKDTANCNK